MRHALLLMAVLLWAAPLRAQEPTASGADDAADADASGDAAETNEEAAEPEASGDEGDPTPTDDATPEGDVVNPFLEEQRAREAAAAEEEAEAQALEDELPPGLDPELYPGDDEDDGDEEAPRQPLRVLASVGGGLSLRLSQTEEFTQETLAPGYVEVLGGVIFPSRSVRIRHGAGLAIALNTDDDGSFFNGVGGGEQIVLAPTYLLRIQLDDDPVPDYFLLAHVAVDAALTAGNGDVALGFEAGADFAYMFLAGLGAYGGVTFSTFLGAQDRSGSMSVHPLLSFEIGVLYDFEVLP